MHEQGGGERFLVHEALVEPAVFAHVESLVGSVDHEGVVEQALFFEVVEQTAYVVIERFDNFGIVAHITLELELGEGASGEMPLLKIEAE